MFQPFNDAPDLPRTVYALNAGPTPRSDFLDGKVETDIAIVGAGITGITAALYAREAGASVAVLEANEIGWGASGRNFGQVVPYLRHDDDHAIRHFGTVTGARLVRAAQQAPEHLFGLVSRYGIACDAVQQGLLISAPSESALRTLSTRVTELRKADAPVELFDKEQIKQAVGGGRYAGGMFDRRGGTVNPFAFVRGLANEAEKKGAKIFSRSRILKVRRDNRWKLETSHGSVFSNKLLICTDSYTDGFWPRLQRVLLPVRVHQLVSYPLSQNVASTILPGRQPVTEARPLPSGVRLHADGRLHLSVDGPVGGPDRSPSFEAATKRVLQLFPQIQKIEWEFSWSGWVGLQRDQYPRLYQLAPDVWAGLGYSGRGVALATMMGRELVSYALDLDLAERLFPVSPIRPIWPHPLATLIARSAVYGYRALTLLERSIEK